MNKFIHSFYLLFVIVLVFVSSSFVEISVSATEIPNIVSGTAILMDAKTGQVLYSKDSEKKAYPASITKIMTCLLALENSSLNSVVTMSHNAVFNLEPGSSHIALREGERISMQSALHALMIASANDAANGIAEYVGGNIDNFTLMMNKRAQEIGCKNTNFVNPHGLYSESHYTTAYDMALITKEAIKNPNFLSFFGASYYVIPSSNKVDVPRPQHTHNKLSSGKKYAYKGFLGGKTGYTKKCGNTLVTYAKRGKVELICVILGSKSPNHYLDTVSLLNYGFSNYDTIKLATYNSCPKKITILNPNKTSKKLTSFQLQYANDIYVTIPKGYDINKTSISFDIPESIILPDTENIYVGKANIYYNNELISSSDVFVADNELNNYLTSQQDDKSPKKSFPIKINMDILVYVIVVLIPIALIIGGIIVIYKMFYKKED